MQLLSKTAAAELSRFCLLASHDESDAAELVVENDYDSATTKVLSP